MYTYRYYAVTYQRRGLVPCQGFPPTRGGIISRREDPRGNVGTEPLQDSSHPDVLVMLEELREDIPETRKYITDSVMGKLQDPLQSELFVNEYVKGNDSLNELCNFVTGQSYVRRDQTI